MATVDNSDGWMTNFIYEQDLTSQYMNSLLYSMFRPGVYNCNITLLPASDSGSTKDSLSLRIRKGTTLVFSNDYVKNGSNHLRRSFNCRDKVFTEDSSNELDKNFPILIKSVALKDIIIEEVASTDDLSCRPWPSSGSSGETTAPNVLYLCAVMRYDYEGTDLPSTPSFVLTRNNPFYNESGTLGERLYYYHTHNDWVDFASGVSRGANGDWVIPDGSRGVEDASKIWMTHYLMLGVLVDPIGRSQYTAFNREWVGNHTFTARCLPEYRYSMIGDRGVESPDFIIPLKSKSANGSENEPFSRMYVDFENVIVNGNIFSTSNDWESSYGVASFPDLIGESNKDHIDYELSSDDRSKVAEYTSDDGNGNSTVALVVDFTFASARNYRNSMSNLDSSEETILVSSSSNKLGNENILKLHNHREILKLSIDDTSVSTYGIYSSVFLKSSEDEGITLDICNENSDRLRNLLVNSDILSRILNKMRIRGEIEPEEGECIIPVAVAFRLLGGEENSGQITITNMTGDRITNEQRVNPLNVLSLLDLDFKMNRLSSLSGMSQNLYTVLPVID